MLYWQSAEREVDFVLDPETFLEVKIGRTSALEFSWFARTFPRARLVVVGEDRVATDSVAGSTMEEFLLQVP
jgi:hypothetical protein